MAACDAISNAKELRYELTGVTTPCQCIAFVVYTPAKSLVASWPMGECDSMLPAQAPLLSLTNNRFNCSCPEPAPSPIHLTLSNVQPEAPDERRKENRHILQARRQSTPRRRCCPTVSYLLSTPPPGVVSYPTRLLGPSGCGKTKVRS